MKPSVAAPLIFLHVPKTGGTTLNTVINRQFGPGQSYAIRSADIAGSVERLKAMPAEQRAGIRLLRGHQAFGLHEFLAPGARYLGMLRHPLPRIASHYNYVKSNPGHVLHADLMARGYDLAGYASSRMCQELSNGQTRMLAGVWGDRDLTEDDLQRAIANVEQHFAWLGLAERFDESLVQLAASLGWTRIYYQKRNVSRVDSGSLLDSAAAAAIGAENQLDLELYAYAQARFERLSAPARLARRLGAAGLGWGNRLLAGVNTLRAGRAEQSVAADSSARN